MSESGETAPSKLPFVGRLKLNSHPTRPWARWVAKGVDLLLVSMFSAPFATVAHYVGRSVLERSGTFPVSADGVEMLGWSLVVGGLAVSGIFLILYDALCVRAYGRTAGKALMGIRCTTRNGANPRFRRAFARSAMMWLIGLGLMIPYVMTIPYIANYFVLKQTGRTIWDGAAGIVVETTPVEAWRWVLGLALLFGGMVKVATSLLVAPLVIFFT